MKSKSSFRERMSVTVSNAEESILWELTRRGLNRHLQTQMPLAFDFEEDGVHGTTIDFPWPPFLYAAYIDGEWPHRAGSRQSERDELVAAALARRGWLVDRFRYRPPLTVARGVEICDQIESRLVERGYFDDLSELRKSLGI